MGVLGDKATLDGDALIAALTRAETPAAIRALVEAGVDIEEARWIGADLEDVFMSETGWTGVQGAPDKGTDHAG
jgi:ABC-2 type transport system ATP-binding protein